MFNKLVGPLGPCGLAPIEMVRDGHDRNAQEAVFIRHCAIFLAHRLQPGDGEWNNSAIWTIQQNPLKRSQSWTLGNSVITIIYNMLEHPGGTTVNNNHCQNLQC